MWKREFTSFTCANRSVIGWHICQSKAAQPRTNASATGFKIIHKLGIRSLWVVSHHTSSPGSCPVRPSLLEQLGGKVQVFPFSLLIAQSRSPGSTLHAEICVPSVPCASSQLYVGWCVPSVPSHCRFMNVAYFCSPLRKTFLYFHLFIQCFCLTFHLTVGLNVA